MWITRKQLNEIIENKLADQKVKYVHELTSKDNEISQLKTRLAINELKSSLDDMSEKIDEWFSDKYRESEEF